MPNILIIGAGQVQFPGIKRAQEMGYSVVAMDGNANAPGLKCADIPIVADIKDAERAIAIAKEHHVAGVFCVAVEAAVRTVACVARALGLPGLSPEAAENATNKHLMRVAWAERGIPSADSRACHLLNEARRSAAAVGFPVIVKPADSAGSRGVALVQSADDLASAFNRALECSPGGIVLVEEFMAGVEISVEAFVHAGKFHCLALSDKIRTKPPHLLDTAVLFPSEQPREIQKRSIKIVADAAEALGIDMAPIHAEVMITEKGPRMVELAARGPGFKVFTDMIPWVTGVDVLGELIKLSVGETPGFGQSQQRGAVLRFPEAGPGIVLRVDGIAEGRRIPGIIDLDIYCSPGDTIKPLASGADRVGHIIALASTRDEAMNSVRRAEAILHIETEPAK